MNRVFLGLGIAALVPVSATWAQIEFQDSTSAAQISFVHHQGSVLGDGAPSDYGAGAAVSDYDLDGDLDIYICDADTYANVLYRNDGGTFTEVAAAAGVADTGYCQLVLFLDLDEDGDDDLVLFNNGTSASRLYENNGDGTFTDRTAGSGFTIAGTTWGGAGAGDYDHDGDLDISAVSWGDAKTYLMRNDGSFTFTDVTTTASAKPVSLRPAWTIVHIDVDNDGWQDIVAAADFTSNYILHNNQDGTFSDISVGSDFDHTGNDMGLAIADIDNNIALDIYVTNITGSGGSLCPVASGPGCNTLNMNDGSAEFQDTAQDDGLDDTDWGWGTVFFDADLDGDRDLAVVTGFEPLPQSSQPSYFYRNDNSSWADISSSSNFNQRDDSRGLIPFDYDNDGDIDLLVTNAMQAARLYENITPRGNNHWFKVKAQGLDGNLSAVGARIYVIAGGQVQMHEVHVGGSFYAGPPLEAHFGLGNVINVDEVRIDFPDGRTVQRFNVGVDQALTLGGLTEVSTLTLIKVGPTGSQLNWDPVEFADGYDILRGDLGALASGDFGACLSDNVLLTQFTDLDSPGPQEAYSYLVRAVTLPGTLGPLGFNPDDTPRTNSNPADCP